MPQINGALFQKIFCICCLRTVRREGKRNKLTPGPKVFLLKDISFSLGALYSVEVFMSFLIKSPSNSSVQNGAKEY